MKISKINLKDNKIVNAVLDVVFYQDREDGDIVIGIVACMEQLKRAFMSLLK
jgi:hypothetical protein